VPVLGVLTSELVTGVAVLLCGWVLGGGLCPSAWLEQASLVSRGCGPAEVDKMDFIYLQEQIKINLRPFFLFILKGMLHHGSVGQGHAGAPVKGTGEQDGVSIPQTQRWLKEKGLCCPLLLPLVWMCGELEVPAAFALGSSSPSSLLPHPFPARKPGLCVKRCLPTSAGSRDFLRSGEGERGEGCHAPQGQIHAGFWPHWSTGKLRAWPGCHREVVVRQSFACLGCSA